MRRLAAALVLSLGLAAPAFADTIDVLKANTLVLRKESGKFYTLLISDDGKMEQVNSAGVWAAGFWSLSGGTYCWTARGAAKLCFALPAEKGVGDSWEIRGPTGRLAWVAEIQEGRADLKAVEEAIRSAAE